jgi:O-antigen/teichoic acid export membrane protein
MPAVRTRSSLWEKAPSLGVAAFAGLAGIGFAGANLLLARWLPKLEYGSFTLAVALINFGWMVAPLGADGMVNRRKVDPGPELFRRVCATCAGVAVVLTLVAGAIYDLDLTTGILVFLGIASGGVALVAAASFQSRQRFPAALMIYQGGNFVLLLGAFLVPLFGVYELWLPLAALVVGKATLGFIGWGRILTSPDGLDRATAGDGPGTTGYTWAETLSYTGIVAGTLALIQLERLIVPEVLSLEALATFGVLAAVAGSPFRMLQMGVGYALLPRLRGASSARERKKVFASEAAVSIFVAGLAAVGIWYVAPWLVEVVAPGKYELPAALVAAAIVAGFSKFGSTLFRSTVEALGSTRDLLVLNVTGWLAVAVAVAGAAVGARWGLTGVIYGVSLGWLVQLVAAAFIGLPKLNQDPELEVTEPGAVQGLMKVMRSGITRPGGRRASSAAMSRTR